MTITRQEWIRRYITYWMAKGGDEIHGFASAEAWLESNPTDIEEKPEDVAEDCFEEEMEQARQDLP